MLKKELLEAINVLILHSDFCDINIDDDRFEVKFSYYGKQDIADLMAGVGVDSKLHSVDLVDYKPEEKKPIAIEFSNESWPSDKKPDSDLEGFKIALANYIKANPDKNQKEIGKFFNISDVTVCTYIKTFQIPYISKIGRRKIYKSSKIKTFQSAPQETIAEIRQKSFNHENHGEIKEETKDKNEYDGDMPNNLKKELYGMIKNAVLNINMAQADAIALKNKFDSFGENGNLITSSLGTWVLKPLNGSDLYLEFISLAISAHYQLFPRWEIGKSYCILQFYGNTKTVEYIINEHNGQMRVSRRP